MFPITSLATSSFNPSYGGFFGKSERMEGKMKFIIKVSILLMVDSSEKDGSEPEP